MTWLLATALAADLERGKHLARETLQCTACHGEDLGGHVMIDAFPMGRIAAHNLTTERTAEAWDEAIRGGVGSDGEGLVMMPSQLAALSDADLADLVAYLDSLPDIEREIPRTKTGPVGSMLVRSGSWESGPHAARSDSGNAALLTVACRSCHGDDLKGRDMGPEGFASDLTTALQGWTAEDFEAAVRRGERPDGSELGEGMPRMMLTDDEMAAIWEELSGAQ